MESERRGRDEGERRKRGWRKKNPKQLYLSERCKQSNGFGFGCRASEREGELFFCLVVFWDAKACRTGERLHVMGTWEERMGNCVSPSCSQNTQPSSPRSMEEDNGGSKRLKLVLTKQQLQQLLEMKLSLEEMVSANRESKGLGRRHGGSWKPDLDTIIE
ncbi:hypothetical protein HPP92_020949 [Vanilla planifolia]|uniref:Uncharacterized protein n=1 Tax=Vanilla planifolia TaxID=51239 RepID=A0A835Q038_VANPL|nr:hypothetical protein HPP92_020949 [Vanilla planifolia]